MSYYSLSVKLSELDQLRGLLTVDGGGRRHRAAELEAAEAMRAEIEKIFQISAQAMPVISTPIGDDKARELLDWLEQCGGHAHTLVQREGFYLSAWAEERGHHPDLHDVEFNRERT